MVWGSFWGRFGIVLGSVWECFGTIWGCVGIVLEWFWDRFLGIVLGSFWDNCGISLGSVWDRFGISFGQFVLLLFFQGGPLTLAAEAGLIGILVIPMSSSSKTPINASLLCLVSSLLGLLGMHSTISS